LSLLCSSSLASFSRPRSQARHRRHGGRKRLPRWHFSLSLPRTARPFPRQNDLAPPFLLYRLDSEETTSLWPRAGHGKRALDVLAVACARAPGVQYRGAWFRYVSVGVYMTLCASSPFLYCPTYQERDLAMAGCGHGDCTRCSGVSRQFRTLRLGQANECAHHVCVSERSMHEGHEFFLDDPWY
jgi:hypothetical protein